MTLTNNFRPRTAGLASLLLSGALALATSAPPAAAQSHSYAIDPDHLSVGFLVHHIGYAKTLGLFRKAEGEFTFDEATGTLGAVRIEIESASVFTNHRKRDEHLKSADFLNASEFPVLVFTADGATAVADRRFRIDGELELLGVRQPVTLEATWNKSGEYPFGGNPYVMGVSARGSFRRSAFGMNYAVDNGWVGDEVELILEFEARRR